MNLESKEHGAGMFQYDAWQPAKEIYSEGVESIATGGTFGQTLRKKLGLIAAIGAGCAAAGLFIGTKRGRTLVAQGTTFMSGRGTQAVRFLRDQLRGPAAREEIREQREFDEKIHLLQEHFRGPMA